jgi:hypothetical protein
LSKICQLKNYNSLISSSFISLLGTCGESKKDKNFLFILVSGHPLKLPNNRGEGYLPIFACLVDNLAQSANGPDSHFGVGNKLNYSKSKCFF